MKAYGFTEYGGAETQDWLELSEPTPMGHEIVVEVRAAGVNPVDWKIRAGYMRAVLPLSLPVAMGREASGIVRAIGTDVDGYALGDEVFGPVASTSGGYAELAVMTAADAAKKPPQLSWTDAAVLPVAGATAYDGIKQLSLTSGQTLLINGVGGGVGVNAAQLARDLGVTVIGIGSERSRALAESVGATLVTYGDGVADRVRAILPDGVDAVFDLVGEEALLNVAPLAKTPEAVVSATDPAGASKVGGAFIVHAPSSETLARLALLVVDGKLDPHVTDIFSFARVADALASVESGHTRGNLVVQVSD